MALEVSTSSSGASSKNGIEMGRTLTIGLGAGDDSGGGYLEDHLMPSHRNDKWFTPRAHGAHGCTGWCRIDSRCYSRSRALAVFPIRQFS
jgi:hypothetical protein